MFVCCVVVVQVYVYLKIQGVVGVLIGEGGVQYGVGEVGGVLYVGYFKLFVFFKIMVQGVFVVVELIIVGSCLQVVVFVNLFFVCQVVVDVLSQVKVVKGVGFELWVVDVV